MFSTNNFFCNNNLFTVCYLKAKTEISHGTMCYNNKLVNIKILV